jgi:4-amino-4-deoxy-L-arabinose transferase
LWYAAKIVHGRVSPLYSPDEGRYTDVALQMLEDGDWLHPKLHPEFPHWSKPPLTYWLIAASFSVVGRNEFAARLPGALAFAGTILLLARIGRRLVPANPMLAALIYATLVLPSVAANLVTTDSLLALWETLCAFAFMELWWATDANAAARARRLLGIAAGLAFMTKGPPGLLTLGACVIFAGWSQGVARLRRLIAIDALLLFAVVGVGWYAWVIIEQPDILHYFLIEEVVNRVAVTRCAETRNGMDR